VSPGSPTTSRRAPNWTSIRSSPGRMARMVDTQICLLPLGPRPLPAQAQLTAVTTVRPAMVLTATVSLSQMGSLLPRSRDRCG
jgi:hypothetical protein